MSEQLTLADVKNIQFLRFDGQNYWYEGAVIGHRHCLLSVPNGLVRHVKEREAKKMKVELMELVPKDRESDLLEALETLCEEVKQLDLCEVPGYAIVAIAKHKGETT